MKAIQTIQRVGFRKWYERELLRSHAHLVLLVLATLALLGSFEAMSGPVDLGDQIVALACAAASGAIGAWALRRYLYLLNHAEHVADQAVCSSCQAYGRWDASPVPGSDGQTLQACCRLCGRRWRISL